MKDKEVQEFQRKLFPVCPRCDTELKDGFLERIDSGVEINPIDMECWECGLEFWYKFTAFEYSCVYGYNSSKIQEKEAES